MIPGAASALIGTSPAGRKIDAAGRAFQASNPERPPQIRRRPWLAHLTIRAGAAGGLVHDWKGCGECTRLRAWALGLYAPAEIAPEPRRATQP